MYGAILGDIIGSPYEGSTLHKVKEFDLFTEDSHFTDDTVMTVAVSEALLNTRGEDDEHIKKALIKSMKKWGRRYPHAGYGARFNSWIHGYSKKPYNSYGNGAAMRVSPAGWLYDNFEQTVHVAELTAEITHNHPEAITAAKAVAASIYLLRNGYFKNDIKLYVEKEFEYNLSKTCDDIRPGYKMSARCIDTVPEAFTAFLDAFEFEDTIRNAVSLGGDTDTIAAIAGSMAEAFYGIDPKLCREADIRLPSEMVKVIRRFYFEINYNRL